MNLNLTPEQRLLVDSARAYLSRSDALAHVRAMETDERGYDPVRWREMAALGWLGVALPPALGGGGQSCVEMVLLLEEMGRVLLPSPYLCSAVVSASVLLAAADAEHRQRWLPRLAAGDLVATTALVEPGWRDEWEPLRTIAEPDGDGWRLRGHKTLVLFAAQADLMLVAAQVRGAEVALVAVAPRDNAIRCRRLATLGGDQAYAVELDGVRVGADAVIGPPTAAAAGLERTRLLAAVASLAFAVGAAERALEMTVEYARTRTQFGRPIGSFQVIAHRCVDMRSDLDALRYLVYQAAWSLATQPDSALAVGAAKAYGNDALRRIFMHAHQVHGAIGFSTEHDLQLFTRRAKAVELQWGSTALHRERVARAMGL
jgi:alkylation response protein AidB-like acyl-CoA dehydrogenase